MKEPKWGFELHWRNCHYSCTSLWQARLPPTVPWLGLFGGCSLRPREEAENGQDQQFSLQFYIFDIQIYNRKSNTLTYRRRSLAAL